MKQQPTISSNGRQPRALGGVLFAAMFLGGEVVAGLFASSALPLPGAPAAEVARYYADNRTAVLVLSAFHALSAVSLLVFVAPLAAFVRRITNRRSILPGLATVGGVVAAGFLLVTALLSSILALTAADSGLDLVASLRSLNFLAGGVAHVVCLGVLVGATSMAARSAGALPGWLIWLGIFASALSLLSLSSLLVFQGALFILLGRMLGFLWCSAAGILLALGKQHETGMRGKLHGVA